MEQYIEIISSQNWSSIFQAIAAIWVAVIATYALGQWKKQIKLQKQVDFVDQLTDEIHEFMLTASPLVSSKNLQKSDLRVSLVQTENIKK
jgi:hypothetical protein